MEYDDYKIEIYKYVNFKRENMKPTKMKLYELSKGKLSISLQNFEGFIFYDQYLVLHSLYHIIYQMLIYIILKKFVFLFIFKIYL